MRYILLKKIIAKMLIAEEVDLTEVEYLSGAHFVVQLRGRAEQQVQDDRGLRLSRPRTR